MSNDTEFTDWNESGPEPGTPLATPGTRRNAVESGETRETSRTKATRRSRAFGTASRRTRSLACVALLTTTGLVAGDAGATLNKANTYYKNLQGSGCQGKVKEFSSSAEKREDYSSVYNVGNYCVSTLEELIGELNGIGSTFRDDQNRSWASSIKRDAIQAANEALVEAKKVRAMGQARSNAKAELARLEEQLKKVAQEFNELNDAHKKRLSEVARAVDDIGRRWKDESKDDLPAYERAVEQVGRLYEQLGDLRRRAYEQSRKSAAAVDAAERAWSSGGRREIEAAYKKMFENINEARSLESQIQSKTREYTDALKKRDDEWNRFVDQAKQSTALLTNDVARTVDRMAEFGREYDPF